MKLNSTQVKQTLSQFQAEVLPDNHPAVAQLNNLFGEHTFFLDGGGLKVLEPVDVPEMATRTSEVVSLADWSDATLTSLRPHEPEMTGMVVVLDDENGVAEVAKLFERAEKASVVAGVEADAGLVKDVKNAAEARADLRGEADALGFAAGERGGGTAEAEIAEADGEKKV